MNISATTNKILTKTQKKAICIYIKLLDKGIKFSSSRIILKIANYFVYVENYVFGHP